jgi:hypothetical protein
MVSANTSANYALASNANISFNAATGNLSVNLLSVTSNANVGNLGTGRVIATGNISGTQLISNIATGTAPLVVTSTTQVANLNATTAGTVITAAQPNITSVGTLTSLAVAGNISAANFIGTGVGSPTIDSATTLSISATSGVSINNLISLSTGSNTTPGSITGNWTLTTGSQLQATIAATANAVAGANVSGAVAFATTANSVAGANVSGAVAFATTANSVAGGNVSGAVAFATTANAVAGANVSGTVSQATTVIGATQNNITTLGALTILSTGANTIAGSITGDWTLTAGSRMQATYADLAEYYEADEKYLPGTVLMFGGEKEVTLAEDGTSKVAGVVSTNPAYVMNATCPGLLTAVALQGRVPCKVRGKISKGDMLISGGNGFARPNQFPSMGTVIGKALQDFDGYEGVIEVAVGRL